LTASVKVSECVCCCWPVVASSSSPPVAAAAVVVAAAAAAPSAPPLSVLNCLSNLFTCSGSARSTLPSIIISRYFSDNSIFSCDDGASPPSCESSSLRLLFFGCPTKLQVGFVAVTVVKLAAALLLLYSVCFRTPCCTFCNPRRSTSVV